MLDNIIKLIYDNQLEEALKLVFENEKTFGDTSELLNIKGIISIKTNEFETAIDCLERALELDENNIDAYYNLGYAYEQMGNSNKAHEMYSKILDLTDDDDLIEEVTMHRERLDADKRDHDSNHNAKQTKYCEIIIKEPPSKKTFIESDDIFTQRKNVTRKTLDDNSPYVSIIVLAYNNLEKHTKRCVESILKYTTDIDYELVLVDNGSADGTFEYFQSISHNKKKIIRITENRGAFYGTFIGMKSMSGEYIVGIPNDVVVTKNWLSNMLKCAESDERIGLVAPASDNVSNLQSVDLGFNSYEEMYEKAEKYNISDPRKWEERLRLATVVSLMSKECLELIGSYDLGFGHDFVDDDLTFRVRRAGYKAIFCKDVFVHHAGSVITGENNEEKKQLLVKGREKFREKYLGIDAWDDINNYEQIMLSMIEPADSRKILTPKVLGIDVRCGTPILQLKNNLRHVNIFDVELSAFVEEPKYWTDLKAICKDVKVDRIDYLQENFKGKEFDYILLGKALNFYKDPYKLLDNMLEIMKHEGHLLLKLRNTYDAVTFLATLGNVGNIQNEVASHVEINMLNKYLDQKGYLLKKVVPEYHNTNENIKGYIMNAIKNSNITTNTEEVYGNMLVNYYILDIVKKV